MSAVLPPLPAQFVSRLTALYGVSRAQEIIDTFSTKRPHSFRVNTLKTTPAQVVTQLEQAGFMIEPVAWAPAYILRNKGLRDLEQEVVYKEGHLYVQGLSSMLPPIVLAPKPGESILDIACAPGSKTTQMASMMQNEGMILANDASRIRMYKLQANLEKQGVSIVHPRYGLGQAIWREFPEVFDRALVDVPCSMEGRFLLSRPKTYQQWSLKKNKELAQRQKALLWSAVSATKVGGVIVYSTCTLAPEENEEVIDWILAKTQGAVKVEAFTISGVPLEAGIPTWQGKTYNQQVGDTARITPSDLYEGFYVAKLRKEASTVELGSPSRPASSKHSKKRR